MISPRIPISAGNAVSAAWGRVERCTVHHPTALMCGLIGPGLPREIRARVSGPNAPEFEGLGSWVHYALTSSAPGTAHQTPNGAN